MPTFRFRLIPFIVTVILVALGCSLAYWQTQRALQKETIETQLQTRETLPAIELPSSPDINQMEYRHVILRGEFVREWPLYLDNRPMQGLAGLVVMMPFKLQGRSHYVLVARGWLPRNSQDRTVIKPYKTPSGIIEIEGMLRANSGRVLELGKSEPLRPGSLIQNLEVDAFEKTSQLPTTPFIIEQISESNDDLLRTWPRASMGSERHRGYAFQWLALAAMALIFFLVTGFRRERK